MAGDCRCGHCGRQGLREQQLQQSRKQQHVGYRWQRGRRRQVVFRAILIDERNDPVEECSITETQYMCDTHTTITNLYHVIPMS